MGEKPSEKILREAREAFEQAQRSGVESALSGWVGLSGNAKLAYVVAAALEHLDDVAEADHG